MKKSNKLLLGGFLTVILIIVGIHIALYANYKNGNYTLVKAFRLEPAAESEILAFQDVKVVRLRNLYSANVYFRDSATVEKNTNGIIQYEQKGDSLFITGHYNGNTRDEEKNRITITVPYNATIVRDSITQVVLQLPDFIKQKIKVAP